MNFPLVSYDVSAVHEIIRPAHHNVYSYYERNTDVNIIHTHRDCLEDPYGHKSYNGAVIELKLPAPCLTFTVNNNSTLTRPAYDAQQNPRLQAKFIRDSDCTVKLDMSMRVPCLDISHNYSVRVDSQLDVPSWSYKRTYSDCDVVFDALLRLPDYVQAGIGDNIASCLTFNIDAVPHHANTYSIGLNAYRQSCTMHLTLDYYMPSFCYIGASYRVNNAIGTWAFAAELLRLHRTDDECKLGLNISYRRPAYSLTFARGVEFVSGSGLYIHYARYNRDTGDPIYLDDTLIPLSAFCDGCDDGDTGGDTGDDTGGDTGCTDGTCTICDQNDFPDDPVNDIPDDQDPPFPGDDTGDASSGSGGSSSDDSDIDDPSTPDCYSTVPDPIPEQT